MATPTPIAGTTVSVKSAMTLTVGTTPGALASGGDFVDGGKFPRGIVLVQKSESGTVHIRLDSETVTTDDPPIPQGTFANGMPVTAKCLASGTVKLVASEASRTVYVYPL